MQSYRRTWWCIVHINRKPASLLSLSDQPISYRNPPDTVGVGVVFIIAVAVPAIIMFLLSMLLVPGASAAPGTPKSLIWRRKLWEWNTAWMGLGVSLAGTFFVVNGLKDLCGKPRPDFLARCQPDLSNIRDHIVGGLGLTLDEALVLVSQTICTDRSFNTLNDGFASFPSGHSSIAFAGLLYFSLWLCSKFAVAIPLLKPQFYHCDNAYTSAAFRSAARSTCCKETERDEHYSSSNVPPRNQAAAPPIYLIILAFIPTGAALFVCASRWFDYHHHGFDIISAALIGIFFAWFGIRLYQLPIRQGAGWSWVARSRDRAFYTGVGIPSYVGREGWDSAKYASQQNRMDLENGRRPSEHNEEAEVWSGEITDHPDRLTLGSPGGLSRGFSQQRNDGWIALRDRQTLPAHSGIPRPECSMSYPWTNLVVLPSGCWPHVSATC